LIRKIPWFLPLVIVLLFLHACQSQPDVPLVVAEVVPTTTTTTVKVPVMIVSQAPPTTTTTLAPTKPVLPSISEPEYRNLFASVNDSHKEAVFYELEDLLPEGFASASAQFQDARANFDVQVWRWPYDGEAAYPFAQELRGVGRSLEALLAKGLPMRSEAEKVKVQVRADTALANGLAQAVPERNAKARAEFELGKTLHTKAQYRASIAAFRKAALLFASAEALAAAETQRATLERSGFAKYSPYDVIEAGRLMAEDESLYVLGDDSSIARGNELLGRARQYYANAYTWGLECDATETRDKALLAKRRADSLVAEGNAADDYEKASASLEQGDENRGASDFAHAADLYRQAEADFDEAYRVAARGQCEAGSAQELAKRGFEYLRAAFVAADIEPDAIFNEAGLFIGLADKALEEFSFTMAKADYLEALDKLAVSQSILQGEIESRRLAAQAKAERGAAEQAASQNLAVKNAELEALRAEKADAERRLAEALAHQETGAQAEAARLSAERAALEKAAAEARAEADRLAAERAAAEQAAAMAAQTAAEAKAESERLAAERAAAEQAARDKAAADQAQQQEATRTAALSILTQAQARYDWATGVNAEHNYPEAYSSGAAQLTQARQAYEAADYQAASFKARTALASLERIAEFAPFPAGYIVDLLPERKNIDSLTFIAAQEYVYNDSFKWGILYQANKAQLKDPNNPDFLLSGQVIVIPSLRGEERSGIWDPKKTYGIFDKGYVSEEEKRAVETAQKQGLDAGKKSRAGAQSALDEGQKAYDKAIARNAKNNHPAALAEARKILEDAKASFKIEDYKTAAEQAKKAAEAFAAIPEFAPLPARYRVRYIPGETDSLWRIAGYPFVYNNNYLWMRLYNANKDLLYSPSDPHIILPGQILTIPSLKGEMREGLWDSKKTYPIYK